MTTCKCLMVFHRSGVPLGKGSHGHLPSGQGWRIVKSVPSSIRCLPCLQCSKLFKFLSFKAAIMAFMLYLSLSSSWYVLGMCLTTWSCSFCIVGWAALLALYLSLVESGNVSSQIEKRLDALGSEEGLHTGVSTLLYGLCVYTDICILLFLNKWNSVGSSVYHDGRSLCCSQWTSRLS